MFNISKNLNLLISDVKDLLLFNTVRYFHIVTNSSKGLECPFGKQALRQAREQGDREKIYLLLDKIIERIVLILQQYFIPDETKL